MKTQSIRNGVAAALGMLFVSGAAQAGYVLPDPNKLSAGQYGDFYVYSLDLLEQCKDNPLCQPFVGDFNGPNQQYSISSGAGQISNQLVIYADASGGQLTNYDNASGPFKNQDPTLVKIDNNFQPPTGSTAVFNMTSGNEPTEEYTTGTGQNKTTTDTFVGDVAGRWDGLLSSIVSYLNGADLVFLFDNNQDGTDLNQQQFLWADVKVVDRRGSTETNIACYQLNNTMQPLGTFISSSQNCASPTEFNEYVDHLNSGSYVGTGGRFCVSKTTGASYIPASGVPSNEGDCGSDYFVSNNLGASFAEFAAFLPHLNANLLGWADAGYFLTIDFKMRNLNDGGEKLWISNQFIPNRVPEPGTLTLAGLGLLGLVGLRRLKQQA